MYDDRHATTVRAKAAPKSWRPSWVNIVCWRLHAVAMLVCLMSACAFCEATESERLTSQDGRLDAVVFDRSCAAFDRVRTHVSIVNAGARLHGSPGNTYRSSQQQTINIAWVGSGELSVDVGVIAEGVVLPSPIHGVKVVLQESQIARLDSAELAPVHYTVNHLRWAAARVVDAMRTGAPPPESLQSFFLDSLRRREAFYAYDAWLRYPHIEFRPDSIVLTSFGADGVLGTPDDIVHAALLRPDRQIPAKPTTTSGP